MKLSSHGRHELKYTLSCQGAAEVKSRLSTLLSHDPHSVGGAYFIRSLYFDDEAMSSYYQKLAGKEERDKLRLRFYNFDSSFIALEKKEKNGKMTVKTSQPVSSAFADTLIGGDFSSLLMSESPFLRSIYARHAVGHYSPSVITDYYRTAFILPYSDVRVTVDENLAASSAFSGFFNREIPCRPVFEGAVLEIKYNTAFPSFIASLLGDIPKQAEAFSKYTLCRETLY